MEISPIWVILKSARFCWFLIDAASLEITDRYGDGRFSCKDTKEGHFAGVSCLACHKDRFFREMHCRLCNGCDKQFPEEVLSSRIRRFPFSKGEVDPTSATGIVALGNEPPSILGAAAALVTTTVTVATLPAAGTGPAAKASAKAVAKANIAEHATQRQAIVDNLTLYEVHRAKATAQSPPTAMLLAKIEVETKRLADHDKQHAKDKKLKDLVSLTNRFEGLNDEVEAIEKRIVSGVITLAHELATRELQLEMLVVECNKKKEERRVARSRCREQMFSKDQLKSFDNETAKAANPPADPEGVWQVPKKTAKQGTMPTRAGISLPHEFHVFLPTEDDRPMD